MHVEFIDDKSVNDAENHKDEGQLAERTPTSAKSTLQARLDKFQIKVLRLSIFQFKYFHDPTLRGNFSRSTEGMIKINMSK